MVEDPKIDEVRTSLLRFLTAMWSGDRDAFLATIVPLAPGDEYGAALADLTAVRLEFRRTFYDAYAIDPEDAVAVGSGPVHLPKHGRLAKIAIADDGARATMPDDHVYELVAGDDGWLVRWPGAGWEGDEEDLRVLRAMQGVLEEFRPRVGAEGVSGPDLVRELMTTMIPAVSRALGRFNED